MTDGEKGNGDMNGIPQAAVAPPAFAGWTSNEQRAVDTAMPSVRPGALPGQRSDHDRRLEQAIAAMSRREESGMRNLYDAAAPRVLGVALRITRNRDAAEDVVAEVFHQAWRTADRYDPARGVVITWLLTICRSRAIDHLRRRDEAESHPDPESLAGAADHDDDPEALLAATRRGDAFHEALARLTPIQRQLIGLAFFRGLSHREAALHVDLPLGTVKTHVRKGLERLRAALADDIPPPASTSQVCE